MSRRIAMVTMHTSPLASPGSGAAGGLNVYVSELARALAPLDVEVDIFTRSHAARSHRVVDLAEGVRVVTLPAGPPRPLAKEELPPHVDAFADAILRFARDDHRHYDLVHAHYWLSGLVGLRLRAAWGTPLVQMFHTLARLKAAHGMSEGDPIVVKGRERGEQQVLSGADAVIAATPLERQAILTMYAARPATVHVIPCGVDGTVFTPGERGASRRRLGLPPDVATIVAAGRFEPLKGFEVLVRAAALLRDRRPASAMPPRLVIAGGSGGPAGRDEYRVRLETLARELCLEEQVVLPGPVPPAALPHYYRAADVCAVPSYYESFGLVALEAMACGTPVVASQVGGLQFTVHDGANGYLVPPGDPVVLADRLGEVLGNDDLRGRLGRAARRSAEAYTWSGVAERMVCLYTYLGLSHHDGRSHTVQAGG